MEQQTNWINLVSPSSDPLFWTAEYFWMLHTVTMVYGCPKEKHEIFLHLYCYSLIIEHMLPPYKCANPPNKCLSFDLRTLLRPGLHPSMIMYHCQGIWLFLVMIWTKQISTNTVVGRGRESTIILPFTQVFCVIYTIFLQYTFCMWRC